MLISSLAETNWTPFDFSEAETKSILYLMILVNNILGQKALNFFDFFLFKSSGKAWIFILRYQSFLFPWNHFNSPEVNPRPLNWKKKKKLLFVALFADLARRFWHENQFHKWCTLDKTTHLKLSIIYVYLNLQDC